MNMVYCIMNVSIMNVVCYEQVYFEKTQLVLPVCLYEVNFSTFLF